MAARIWAKRLRAVVSVTRALRNFWRFISSRNSEASSLMNELGWQETALPVFVRKWQCVEEAAFQDARIGGCDALQVTNDVSGTTAEFV